jgi:hypothetical protein
MKKLLIYSLLLSVPVSLIISAYSGDGTKRYPSGAPAGYTGSPADGNNCTYCHNGNASPVTGWITSDVDPNGYVPGNTYTITITVTGTGAKGFEVSPQGMNGNLIGTLIPGDGSKLVGSDKYVTHTSASNSATKIWTFSWTAPQTGTGDVTFYGAFAVSKPVTKLSTLVIPQNLSTSLQENEASRFSIFPNPAESYLNVNYFMTKDNHLTIELYNIAGQRITLLADEWAKAGNFSMTVSIPEYLKNGTYLVKITSGGKTLVKKVTVSR